MDNIQAMVHESTKKYKKSFLDCLRRKAGFEHREFYKLLGWDRWRYFNHIKLAYLLDHASVKDVAKALDLDAGDILAEQYKFING